jgi:hypothetical protein
MPYDTKIRSFSINHIVNRYAVALETNIRTHAFSRIKRAIAGIAVSIDRKVLQDACYARFYGGVSSSGCSPVDEWFDSRSPRRPWRWSGTTGVSCRCFAAYKSNCGYLLPRAATTTVTVTTGDEALEAVLFPQFSHGLKHLLYDSCALNELLRHTHRNVIPSTWKAFTIHQ